MDGGGGSGCVGNDDGNGNNGYDGGSINGVW